MNTTPYTHTLAAERQPENRCLAVVDGEGYVTSLRVLSAAEPSLEFFKFMREQRRVAVPLEREAIVMPVGWTLNTDGTASPNEETV